MILAGKSAIVTGAGRGVGRGIALEFAKQGADVLVNAAHEETARDTARALEPMGRKVIAYKANIANEGEVLGMFKAALDAFGKLDILVNNAGNSAPSMLHKMTIDQW